MSEPARWRTVVSKDVGWTVSLLVDCCWSAASRTDATIIASCSSTTSRSDSRVRVVRGKCLAWRSRLHRSHQSVKQRRPLYSCIIHIASVYRMPTSIYNLFICLFIYWYTCIMRWAHQRCLNRNVFSDWMFNCYVTCRLLRRRNPRRLLFVGHAPSLPDSMGLSFSWRRARSSTIPTAK